MYGGGGQQQVTKVMDEDDIKLSKKEMDRDINKILFSSRVAEMKQVRFALFAHFTDLSNNYIV